MQRWIGQDLLNLQTLTADELWVLYPNLTIENLKRRKRQYKQKGVIVEKVPQSNEPNTRSELEKISQAFKEHNIDLTAEELARGDAGFHLGYIRNSDGEIEYTKPLPNVKFSRTTGEENEVHLPYLSEAAPVIVRATRVKKLAHTSMAAVDIPDLQWGYREIEHNEYMTTHDPDAVDLALQITKYIQPNKIYLGGDELDLPQLSRWPKDSLHMVSTLQMSIDGLHMFLARLRGDSPDADICNLTSNHVQRFQTFMLQNAEPLFGIKPANMKKEQYPAISYPSLLRLKELDIRYSDGGYPASMEKITEGLYTFHGDKSNRWSTAGEYIKEYDFSVLYHHDHRRGVATRTLPSGKTIMAFGNGSLCRIDGAVPGTGTSVGDRSEVGHRQMNWTQGMGVIFYEEGSSNFQEVHIPFYRNKNGRLEAKYMDKTFIANIGGFTGLKEGQKGYEVNKENE